MKISDRERSLKVTLLRALANGDIWTSPFPLHCSEMDFDVTDLGISEVESPFKPG